MGAVSSPETFVHVYQITKQCFTEDSNVCTCCPLNLKFWHFEFKGSICLVFVLPNKHVLQRLCDNEVIIMHRKFCVLHLSDQEIYVGISLCRCMTTRWICGHLAVC